MSLQSIAVLALRVKPDLPGVGHRGMGSGKGLPYVFLLQRCRSIELVLLLPWQRENVEPRGLAPLLFSQVGLKLCLTFK